MRMEPNETVRELRREPAVSAEGSFRRIYDTVQRVIIGNEEATMLLLIALLAGGHVLIEDIPGVGKTLLAQALARATSLRFSRIQCTPDILPSDVLGFSLYDVHTGKTEYKPGPVMSNLVLVDEINRASPKTQSSLLEVMEENQATVDGLTHPLPQPFMTVATQNPIESVGTSPLPEAQLDRFMMRLSMGYPSPEQEIHMLERFRGDSPLDRLSPVIDQDRLLALRGQVGRVHVAPQVQQYLVEVVSATRRHGSVRLGASPRATLALMRACQALALIEGRDYVSPGEVKALAAPVLAHRLILRSRLGSGELAGAQRKLVAELLGSIRVPAQ